jgi:hypothetical protein
MKFFRLFLLFIILGVPFLAVAQDNQEGADVAAPRVADFMGTLPLIQGTIYTLSDDETVRIIELASRVHINVFELLDCTYRYLAPHKLRIAITGEAMRKLLPLYDLGQDRVLALLPLDKMIRLETGASLSAGQTALDIFLEKEYQTYIEIGTAIYQKRFGFAQIEPLLFAEPYGIMVKKLFFSAPLVKLELYAPGKGAIYAKGLFRPKRWNLWVVTKK